MTCIKRAPPLVIKMSVVETRVFMQYLIAGLGNIHSTIHLTNIQLRLLQNAVYNLMFNNTIELSDKDKRYFQRYSRALKHLANKYTPNSLRRDIVKQRKALIRRVAHVIYEYVKEN